MKLCSKICLALVMTGYSDAYFRMSCPGRTVRDRIDPIVNPGVVAGHVHTVTGGSGFKANMTFADARASKCSSCEIKEDLSNYWTPTLYVHKKDGTFSPVPVVGDGSDTQSGMTIWYLQRKNTEAEKLHAFPAGFRMLAGDTTKRIAGRNDVATKAIFFSCLDLVDHPDTNSIPAYKCRYGMRAQIYFPSCWNGRDLDSSDHRSHMSYPASSDFAQGPCPAAFPIHTISLFYEVIYNTALFDDQWNGTSHPFVFSNGDATGYGFHGDFLNGWDVNVLQKAVDTCTDPTGQVEKCGAVTQFSVDQARQCYIPPTVDEPTSGSLPKLPGCNPLTSSSTQSSVCTDSVQFRALKESLVI